MLLVLQTACATGLPRGGPRTGVRDVAASTEDGRLAPSSDFASVRVSDVDLREALARLVLEMPLRVATRPRRVPDRRLVRASWAPGDASDSSVEGGYARLCERRGSPGDCFSLLGEGPEDITLSRQDRFALALGLALQPAVDAAMGELRDASASAMTALLTGLSLYLVVLLAPEPLSKGLALTMTLLLWSYLGHELWGLLTATKQLWDDADDAHTFRELRGASERYARVLGPNTLRVLLLLATWKVGAAANEGTTGSALPGLSQAVRNAATVGRIHLPTAASEATSVSVAEGRLVLTLPAGSGAVLAMQQQGDGEQGELHHIATVENEKSPARGGPWTPKLKRFFDKAGMSMEEPVNKVRIPGHKGPHPRAYHERVYQRLEDAVEGCTTPARCREALTRELETLAKELKQVGSELHQLVTGSF
jgi:hypothetical protein